MGRRRSVSRLRRTSTVRIENLHVDGRGAKSAGVDQRLFVLGETAQRGVFDSVSFAGCDRACIDIDHAHDLAVRDSEFHDVGLAVSLVFSHCARVTGNRIVNARLHGIQWGHWKCERKDCKDLVSPTTTSRTEAAARSGGPAGAVW